jgi:hypothetical protein
LYHHGDLMALCKSDKVELGGHEFNALHARQMSLKKLPLGQVAAFACYELIAAPLVFAD